MTIDDPTKSEIVYAKFSQFLLNRDYTKFVNRLDLQENDKIIDFGSGTGFLAKKMTRKLTGDDSWISCVEISDKWNDIARKKLRKFKNIDFYTGMITELDLKENYYDKVIIHFVLHDIAKKYRESIIKSLAKRLKKRGQLIIRDPSNPTHGMPVEEIREYMQKAGMVEISSEIKKYIIVGPVFYGVFEKR